jgi:multiple sugar transport system substrate-binding protein
MKFMRSTRTAIAVGLVGALALTGCGRTDTGPGTDSDEFQLTDGPATGELSVWAMGNEGELLPAFAEKFAEENPDLTITVTSVPWADARQKIETAIAGGTTPDMSLLDLGYMPSFVASGGLQTVPSELVDPTSFFDGANTAVTLEGSAYAVPWYISTRVLLYRTDLAAAAGVEAPGDWDEFREFAAGLQQAGAVNGTLMPFGKFNDWQTLLPFFWQAGGSVLTEDGSGYAFDSPAMVEALTYIKSFYDAGITTPEGPIETGELQADFVNGEYGSYISGPWEVTSLRNAGGDEFVDTKLGAAVLPTGPGGTNTAYAGGGALAVFNEADNPDAAWKFIRWLAQPETQVEWYKEASVLPAVQSAWDDPILADNEFISVFGAQLESVLGPPPVATWAEVGAMIDEVVERVARGVQTPEDAAAEIQERASQIGTGL